jgi:hypothetical protein
MNMAAERVRAYKAALVLLVSILGPCVARAQAERQEYWTATGKLFAMESRNALRFEFQVS